MWWEGGWDLLPVPCGRSDWHPWGAERTLQPPEGSQRLRAHPYFSLWLWQAVWCSSSALVISLPICLGSHLWFACGFLGAEFCEGVSVLATLKGTQAPIWEWPMRISLVLLHSVLVKTLMALLLCSLTLSKWLYLFEPAFPPRALVRIRWINTYKCLEQCLAHSKHSTSINRHCLLIISAQKLFGLSWKRLKHPTWGRQWSPIFC